MMFAMKSRRQRYSAIPLPVVPLPVVPLPVVPLPVVPLPVVPLPVVPLPVVPLPVNTYELNQRIDEYTEIVTAIEKRTKEQCDIVSEWNEVIKNMEYRALYNSVLYEFLHLISLTLPS
jgi:hypothetical protein